MLYIHVGKLCALVFALEVNIIHCVLVFSVFEKQHTCTSFSGRSFQDLQLWEIAEELHVDKLIPFSLRLGLTYARICSIREDSKSHSVDVRYNVMVKWQKDQTAQIDQVETLARILEACRERRIAYKIRKFSVDSCCSNV